MAQAGRHRWWSQRGVEHRRTGRTGAPASGTAHGPDGERDPPPGGRILRQGDAAGPKMTYTFIARACTDLPVTACCRVMRVSTSGFYAWQAEPVRAKDLDDAYLSDTIVDIWTMSRRSYGSPRVHAELKLGLDVRCSRKRVERLMRQAGVAGIHRRRRGGCTKRDPSLEPSDDLVQRAFDPAEPDRLWVMDVERHEALLHREEVRDLLLRPVAAGW